MKTLGSAIRPGVVLAVFVVGGTMIGRKYDSPIEGLAIGLAGAAIFNGVIDYNAARAAVS